MAFVVHSTGNRTQVALILNPTPQLLIEENSLSAIQTRKKRKFFTYTQSLPYDADVRALIFPACCHSFAMESQFCFCNSSFLHVLQRPSFRILMIDVKTMQCQWRSMCVVLVDIGTAWENRGVIQGVDLSVSVINFIYIMNVLLMPYDLCRYRWLGLEQ